MKYAIDYSGNNQTWVVEEVESNIAQHIISEIRHHYHTGVYDGPFDATHESYFIPYTEHLSFTDPSWKTVTVNISDIKLCPVCANRGHECPECGR